SVDIESVLEVIHTGGKPSQQLASKVPEFADCWRAFDDALEDSIVEVVMQDACPELVRRRLIAWLSGYMSRAITLATGRFGNELAVSSWLECLEAARTGESPVPIRLEKAARGLLFPEPSDGGLRRMVIKAFANRIEPVATNSLE